jgi:hypothetical protein
MKKFDDDLSILSRIKGLENLDQTSRFPCPQAVFNPRPVRSAIG